MKLPLLLTALLLAITSPLDAQTTPRVSTREGHRFLILIEASKDMNRLADGVIETSLHLVNTGFNGQIRDGDAFVIWLYRDRVASHLFEPTIWSSSRLKEHATYVERFVAPLKFEGQADLALAMKELLSVGTASESATLILLSPGEKPVTGTPFDDYIKAAYAREGRQSRSAKLPVVTSFLASGGAIVDCVVSKGGTNLALPTLPESLRNKPKIIAAPAPVVPTNAPVQKKSTAPPPKKKAAAESAPVEATTAIPSTARVPAPAGTNSLGMSLAPIAPRPLSTAGAAEAPSSNTPPAVVAAAVPPAPPSPPPQSAPLPPAPPAAATTELSPPPQTDSAPSSIATVPSAPSPVRPAENSSVPTAGSSPRRTSLILAGVLIGAAGVLALVLLSLLLRPARGSSISAVMDSTPPRANPAEARASSSGPVPPS